jgi:hypothetical protein
LIPTAKHADCVYPFSSHASSPFKSLPDGGVGVGFTTGLVIGADEVGGGEGVGVGFATGLVIGADEVGGDGDGGVGVSAD